MSQRQDVAGENMAQRADVGGQTMPQRGEVLNEQLSQPKDLSAEELLQRKDLAKEVIAYLSKEIETVTNGMMVFRSKISFAVLVGPFLILGTLVYAAKGLHVSADLGASGWGAIGLVFLCYLALAFLSGRIEEDGWRQCNKWRILISDLQKDPKLAINQRNVRTDANDIDPVNWMKWSYLGACFLMLLAFASLLFLLLRVNTTPVVTPQATTVESTRQQPENP